MTADNGAAEGATWPMPKFSFEVDFGDELRGAFQEISGMDVENQAIEYRKSNSPGFSTEKTPGVNKHRNVTMKRGVFINGDTFWSWYQPITMNTITRRTVLIKLLDESGKVTMQWTLNNAWPTKMTSSDLIPKGNEVAVETLEMAYEHLTISNG